MDGCQNRSWFQVIDPMRAPTGAEHRRLAVKALLGTLLVLAALGTAPDPAVAAELDARTSRAYDAYLEQAQRAFIARARGTAVIDETRAGVVVAGPAVGDGVVAVPDGLVHHWIGSALIRGVTLRDAVNMSSSYADYRCIYKSVVASQLLEHAGDTYRALMRLTEGDAGVSAVLQIQTTVRYFRTTDDDVYALSNADVIREVRNAGRPGEQLLPAGRDSGYLWRANTFTRFVNQKEGVYVEMETLGLSRRFPALLGWLLEPIARRLGRKSVETSLRDFLVAVRAGRGCEAEHHG
jgi:hypothetical protein